MPLPPALAAKLAKRGLLGSKTKSGNPPGFVEEVIAESYDDPKSTASAAQKPKAPPEKDKDRDKENTSKLVRIGHPGCPNKGNVYHTCSNFCVRKWGVGKTHPEAKYDLRRRKMLKKYPLPDGWLEVFDPGMGRYFYWDTSSDNVCWHSPRHPSAKVGKAAAELRVKLSAEGNKVGDSGPVSMSLSTAANRPDYMEVDRDRERDRDRLDRERDNRSYHDNRFKKPDPRDRRRRNRDDDELDPMDPSSYSDVPRGTWSSGLLPEGAKTGVDTTASGSLFQQRPLPSPGAVLRANAEKTSRK